jgi:hypothetical protein
MHSFGNLDMLVQTGDADRRRHAKPRGAPWLSLTRVESTMSDQKRTGTFASRVLARRPELRKQVLESSGFQNWVKSHSTVVVDGTRFYVVGGDMLRDEDEMILNWSRREGLIDQRTIERLQSEEPSDYTS